MEIYEDKYGKKSEEKYIIGKIFGKELDWVSIYIYIFNIYIILNILRISNITKRFK